MIVLLPTGRPRSGSRECEPDGSGRLPALNSSGSHAPQRPRRSCARVARPEGPRARHSGPGYATTRNKLSRWCHRIESYLDSALAHDTTAVAAICAAVKGRPWMQSLPAIGSNQLTTPREWTHLNGQRPVSCNCS